MPVLIFFPSQIEITTGFFTGHVCLLNSFEIMDFPSYSIIAKANIGGINNTRTKAMNNMEIGKNIARIRATDPNTGFDIVFLLLSKNEQANWG